MPSYCIIIESPYFIFRMSQTHGFWMSISRGRISKLACGTRQCVFWTEIDRKKISSLFNFLSNGVL